MVQEALLRALKAKKTAFVELIMDFESDVKVDLMKIGISDWLHTLYNESVSVSWEWMYIIIIFILFILFVFVTANFLLKLEAKYEMT